MGHIRETCFTPFINRSREIISKGETSIGKIKSTVESALRHDRFESLHFKLGGQDFIIPHAVVFNAATLVTIFAYEYARSHGVHVPGSDVILGHAAVSSISGSGGPRKIYLDDGSGTDPVPIQLPPGGTRVGLHTIRYDIPPKKK